MRKDYTAKISIASGQTINASAMTLYEEQKFSEAAAKWQEADKKLRSVGGTIGFFGSPIFVAGALTASAIFTKWQQGRLEKEAAELIDEAQRLYKIALDTGKEFEWGQVSDAGWPDPSRWSAEIFENLKRKVFVPKPEGQLLIRTVEGTLIWVLWSMVATYELV